MEALPLRPTGPAIQQQQAAKAAPTTYPHLHVPLTALATGPASPLIAAAALIGSPRTARKNAENV